ncbi:MAG: STAS domain-containing protein [Acidimicrobiales bacterium]
MQEVCMDGPAEGTGASVALTEPLPTAPPMGVIVLTGTIDVTTAARLDAELQGRIAVGTQVLIVDVRDAHFADASGLGVLADAARRLQDERLGSLVLRNADAPLLRYLRMLRLDHVFELEI